MQTAFAHKGFYTQESRKGRSSSHAFHLDRQDSSGRSCCRPRTWGRRPAKEIPVIERRKTRNQLGGLGRQTHRRLRGYWLLVICHADGGNGKREGLDFGLHPISHPLQVTVDQNQNQNATQVAGTRVTMVSMNLKLRYELKQTLWHFR